MKCSRTELGVYTWKVLVQRWNALRLNSGMIFKGNLRFVNEFYENQACILMNV